MVYSGFTGPFIMLTIGVSGGGDAIEAIAERREPLVEGEAPLFSCLAWDLVRVGAFCPNHIGMITARYGVRLEPRYQRNGAYRFGRGPLSKQAFEPAYVVGPDAEESPRGASGPR